MSKKKQKIVIEKVEIPYDSEAVLRKFQEIKEEVAIRFKDFREKYGKDDK